MHVKYLFSFSSIPVPSPCFLDTVAYEPLFLTSAAEGMGEAAQLGRREKTP